MWTKKYKNYAHLCYVLCSLQGDRDRIGECLQFMTGLVSLVQHHSLPHIPIQANEVLLLLHQPENIELWDKNDPMTAFWDISGQVYIHIRTAVVEIIIFSCVVKCPGTLNSDWSFVHFCLASMFRHLEQ